MGARISRTSRAAASSVSELRWTFRREPPPYGARDEKVETARRRGRETARRRGRGRLRRNNRRRTSILMMRRRLRPYDSKTLRPLRPQDPKTLRP
eukprot:9483920-Pyramimonas_sp.AAC.2